MMSRVMKDSGVEWIGEIPKSWITAKLLNFLKRPITDGPHETPNYAEEGVPFISVNAIDWQGNINRNVNTFITEEDARKYNEKINLEVGDILFTKSATIGKVAIVDEVDFMVWSPIAVIKPKDGIDNNFLKFIFQCNGYLDYVSNLGTKNTQVNVGMRAMEKAKISVPSALEEQKKIASFLDEKVVHIDNILEDTKKSIEYLKAYKQSLITEIVTKGLNANVEMKNSGIEWIGEIPKHWESLRIKYASYLKGRIGWQGLTSEEYQDEGPYLITGKDLINGKVNWSTCTHITKERFDEAPDIHIENQDLLITKDGTIGKVALVSEFDDKASLNSGVLLIRKTKDCYNEKFLYYILISDVFWRWFNLIKSPNSTILHLYQNDFKDFSYPLPHISEQQQIADYLDEKTAHLDSLLRNKEKMLEELKAYKKSLIYEYVTGKKEVQ